MSSLETKKDFAVVIVVSHANPNGDPLDGNRPRETYDGHGEISDVCLKRKIRNRLMDMGESVFVQSADNNDDGYKSLKERADAAGILKEKDPEKLRTEACGKWIDVRAFGQLFAFKKGSDKDSVSLGIRGPVTIQSAFSVDPIEINSMQITKSVNSEPGEKKGSDTMGTKHSVDFGVYVAYGSMNPQLAEKTGFSEGDAESIKKALATLFENDESSARPAGTMYVYKVYWWNHNSKAGQYSPAKVHNSLHVKVKDGVDIPRSIDDYEISLDTLEGLTPEIIDGN
jgi:CRISPR-associated protein Csd2